MQLPKHLGCSRPGRRASRRSSRRAAPLYMTQNGPRVIYISADLFISPRDFSFRRPVRCGICREFQAFAASVAAAAHKKGVFGS
jgi:hypothetical protein